MADTRPFRVIIGGGGISGLTLANALEKAGIDYILLEARDKIAPQVGASIGIFSNGSRILDQLGCFKPIEEATIPTGPYHSRYSNGDLIYVTDGTMLIQKRFNYVITFLEREIVLRTLYNNLEHQSNVKLLKRITKVDHNAKEVIVVCEDGTAISGDILVGCDGVHSKVREELWRISQLQDPAAVVPADKESMLAEYICLYGISSKTQGVEEGYIEVNYSKDFSTMVIGGKGKVFWFLFEKLDQICKSQNLLGAPAPNKVPNIPRYTKEDSDRFGEKHRDQIIKPGLKFGDIWNNRTSYTLVPTEESMLKQWSWGRMACLGDTVHKMTPNLGAGGNAAIETAAALANELKKMVDSAEKGKPSFDTIKTHLGNYQKIREQRITAICEAANGLTRVHALKTWKDKMFAFWILPSAGDLFTNLNCDIFIGSVKLDYLPLPERSLLGNMPFNPSQGLGLNESKLRRAIKALPFLAITAVAVYFMWGVALPPMLERIGEIMEHGVKVNPELGQPGVLKTLHNFYGLEFIDSRLRGLSACFAPLQFVDAISSWQSFTFLTDAGIVYAILLIEAARRVNVLTFASIPLLLGYNMQFFGIGVLMALYCFVHYIQSPIENFRSRDLRLTNMSYTASVLPVLVLAHYIPMFASYSTYLSPRMRHVFIWIWQPFPIYVSAAQYLLKKTVMPDTEQVDRVHHTERDLPTINLTVGSLCALSAAMWWYTLYSSPFSWATLFVPNLATGQNGDAHIRMFLQFDEIFAFAACFLWLLYLYGDMKKAGMMNDSWVGILLKGVVSLVAFGPGVTVGLAWLYREKLLATRWHKDALVPGKK